MTIAQTIKPKSPDALYDRDFVAWTEEQGKLLRAGKLDAIDLANLIEEIESLGRSDRRGTDSQLVRLQAHILNWQIQPEKRCSSWRGSIADARNEIALFFEQSPSLRRHAHVQWLSDYTRARRLAAAQTKLALSAIPDEPPFTLDQILDDDFWPD